MKTNLGETERERELISAVWRVQDSLPNVVRHMKVVLREGEFKKYVEHLAAVAGCFIGMGEEVVDTLLTEGERESLEGEGIAGAILEDLRRAED